MYHMSVVDWVLLYVPHEQVHQRCAVYTTFGDVPVTLPTLLVVGSCLVLISYVFSLFNMLLLLCLGVVHSLRSA